MSNVRETRISLGMRQIDVQRRNLVQMCRLTVKSLIDKSSFEPVDDNSDELVNFFAVMEQLLLHRIKPQKSWFGVAESNHYWDYIKVACRKLSNNCITNIESIENIKTARGKGRAWLRVALMEKRLSEYFSNALSQPRVTKKFYLEGSVMLSEDSGMLCGTLLGLNSIDFSFCLKGDNMELMGPLVIDYSPYLLFYHSDESMRLDNEEKLTNSNIGSSIMSEVDMDDVTWSEKCKRLEQKYKNITEQKGYLEELVRLRQSQLDEATRQRHQLLDTLEHYESESRRERQQLEGVIIELQGQLSAVKEQLKRLQRELSSLRARVLPLPDGSDQTKTSLAMREMTEEQTLRLPRHILSSQESDVQSITSSDISTHLAGEPRSLLTQSALKEETQSLVPLAGSFSSEVSFRSGDIQMSALPKTFGEISSDGGGEMKMSVENLDTQGPVTSVKISVSDVEDSFSATQSSEKPVVNVMGQSGEENGNNERETPVECLPVKSGSDGDSPEVRSSPDGEVGSENKTLAAAIVSGLVDNPAPDDQKELNSGDESSDDGRSPPGDMTIEETSSDNSNGEWTLLPRSEEQQDQSSAEDLGAPEQFEVQQEQSSAEELGVPDDGLPDVPDIQSDADSPDVLPDTGHQTLPSESKSSEADSTDIKPEEVAENSG